MNIKLSISLLLFFGVISGCSNNTNNVETADTSVENVAEEQIPVEEEAETELKVVQVDDSKVDQTLDDDGVVEGMGHDYNDPYYTDRVVENEVDYGMGHYTDENIEAAEQYYYTDRNDRNDGDYSMEHD